jgi:hypothetical protein
MENKESENIIKLREIVKKMEDDDLEFEVGYKKITNQIDDLVHKEILKITSEKNKDSKIKCYEALFTTIISMIEGGKHIIQ